MKYRKQINWWKIRYTLAGIILSFSYGLQAQQTELEPLNRSGKPVFYKEWNRTKVRLVDMDQQKIGEGYLHSWSDVSLRLVDFRTEKAFVYPIQNVGIIYWCANRKENNKIGMSLKKANGSQVPLITEKSIFMLGGALLGLVVHPVNFGNDIDTHTSLESLLSGFLLNGIINAMIGSFIGWSAFHIVHSNDQWKYANSINIMGDQNEWMNARNQMPIFRIGVKL